MQTESQIGYNKLHYRAAVHMAMSQNPGPIAMVIHKIDSPSLLVHKIPVNDLHQISIKVITIIYIYITIMNNKQHNGHDNHNKK